METPTLRPVADSEQGQAIRLWNTVFSESPGFFERYYSAADPDYQTGDTLGAWSDGRLVSAVHLCRRPATWGDERLLCGAIANVATLPEFRRQGLSRRLLELAIRRMEGDGFHFSLLGTGVHGHYAALGWERVNAPRVTIRLNPSAELAAGSWRPLDTVEGLLELYAVQPRPLQFVRPEPYFHQWVGWNWRRSPKQVCMLPGQGYLVIHIPEDPESAASVTEWRAVDAEAERTLLQAAAGEALGRGLNHLDLDTFPQHLGEDFLQTLGVVSSSQEEGSMLRNVTLSDDRYRRLTRAFHTGAAVWWSGDAF